MDSKKTPLVMLDRMVAGRVDKVEEGEAEFIYSFLDTNCDRGRDETYVKNPKADSADPEDFEIRRLPKFNWKPDIIAELQSTAIRGPHGTIPIRVLPPESTRRGPATRLPSDAPMAEELESGTSEHHLQCKGVTEFADHYFRRPDGPAPHEYDENVAAGLQGRVDLSKLSPAIICTNGFGPLRDADSQYVNKLHAASQPFYAWHRSTKVLHGWMQLTEWYNQSREAVDEVGQDVKMLLYGERPDDEARRVKELYG
ncbi:hypothetical protein C8A01DRAFT_35392 [Parachaetomium inaequale]|uniref:Alpha/beta hydrolase fold-3 domain-containing protein n=1 Tax=Parachaetomium inaequale TaxID=2588326 RepID=A0AAN6SSP6_9PEZI|nr:hypothetical protein C8A01DRAFT_35392 [Parachaetomium inaequale]